MQTIATVKMLRKPSKRLKVAFLYDNGIEADGHSLFSNSGGSLNFQLLPPTNDPSRIPVRAGLITIGESL